MPLFYNTRIRAFTEILILKISGWHRYWNANAKYKEENSESVHATYIKIAVLRRCNWTFMLIVGAIVYYVCSLYVCLFSTNIRTSNHHPFARLHEYMCVYSTDLIEWQEFTLYNFTECTIVCTRVQSRLLCRLFVRAALLCITLNISLHSWFSVRDRERDRKRKWRKRGRVGCIRYDDDIDNSSSNSNNNKNDPNHILWCTICSPSDALSQLYTSHKQPHVYIYYCRSAYSEHFKFAVATKFLGCT